MSRVLLLLALTGCGALEGTCETVAQLGPGMSGLATYTLGDGTRLEADLDKSFADTRTDGFEVHGTLVDQWGIERAFTLAVGATTAGTYDLAAIDARVCMVRQSGADEVCSALTGTLELRAHEKDCYFHSSGIGQCANTLDFTIVGRSEWQTTVFTVDGDMLTEGSWIETECD